MIKRADYFRYHKLLAQGIRDEELLSKMISDALETAHRILDNSQAILNPEAGTWCECGCRAEWDPRLTCWRCTHCGKHTDWTASYEEEEAYTEQTGKLMYLIHELEEAGPRERGAWFEALMEFWHASGCMARFYIQGGMLTLTKFEREFPETWEPVVPAHFRKRSTQ